MKTCPKCGAENRMNATECRLCATSLEIGAAQSYDTAPSMAAESPDPAHAICPVCQAINEPEWVFCMQCGKKLPGRGPKLDGPDVAKPQASGQPADSCAAQPAA